MSYSSFPPFIETSHSVDSIDNNCVIVSPKSSQQDTKNTLQIELSQRIDLYKNRLDLAKNPPKTETNSPGMLYFRTLIQYEAAIDQDEMWMRQNPGLITLQSFKTFQTQVRELKGIIKAELTVPTEDIPKKSFW